MPVHRFLPTVIFICLAPVAAIAQATTSSTGKLQLELNALQDVGAACRLTFVVENRTGTEIEQAVFEAVIFDTAGGVTSLSLFDFRDLPADRPRVRQFDLPGIACESVGRALINGANTCNVEGERSDICDVALQPASRLNVELLG